ncbi:MAG: two-component system, sensor histidine kinase RegB [Gallionellaceae bacterium]|nr:MAG: two-component system, sensor histidine kinase RegB [Gallionellaceae bacterium]
MLRNWAILAQFATLILVHRFLSTDFAWTPMVGTVVFLVLANLLTWWRLSLDYPVSNLELFLQLCLDVNALTVLLYFGGGSTNPFVSLYLLPLVLAAATLPRRYTWGMAALTVACYSLLMVWYVPLPTGDAHAAHSGHTTTVIAASAVTAAPVHDHTAMQMDHSQHQMHQPEVTPSDYCRTEPESAPASASADTSPLGDAFNAHVLGMWLGFVISATVIAYFAVEMAAAVRLREAQLTQVREETLRNERIVSLGTLAASAAHELGTPLSTMSVVIGEMQNECESPDQKESLTLLDDQVRNCKRILNTLVNHAQATPEVMSIEGFLLAVLDEWQLLRPTVHYHYQVGGPQPAPQLRPYPALRAALLNLLNNAADASSEGMHIQLHWDDKHIVLEIQDQGPGLTVEAASRAGSAFFTTKEEGRGLGLFLANATLERLGGNVRLFNRDGGGATTEVTLPLQGLRA